MATPPTYPPGDWRKPNRKVRTELLPGQPEYLDWLCSPAEEGRPTKRKFAESLGVSQSTLDNWRRDPLFVKEWERRLAAMNVSPDRTQAVLDAMWGMAAVGNVKAAELYMRLVDRMTPNRLVIEDGRVEDMTDEELAVKLRETLTVLEGGAGA